MKRVIIGMSGGVDSSVAAALLKEEGYEVIGITLRLWDKNSEKKISKEAIDAKRVCDQLNIQHYTLDFRDEFKDKVINKFVLEYFEGRTPNPCIECNKYLKFKYLLEKAIDIDCDYIATGHYAICEYDENSDRYLLKKSKADKKDQTYVLYNLTQEQLKRVLFPLGKFNKKEEIREVAIKMGLEVAGKKDSQDICFIPDGNYKEFLKQYDKNNIIRTGNIVDLNGNILGKHTGIINYTIGQRKGLGLSMPNPTFVVNIDKEKNTVIVGEEKDLYTNELQAKNINWIMFDKLEGTMKVKAKTRYSAKLEDATIYMKDEDTVKAIFDNPQRAITKGQAVVFYKDDYIVGGGTII